MSSYFTIRIQASAKTLHKNFVPISPSEDITRLINHEFSLGTNSSICCRVGNEKLLELKVVCRLWVNTDS